MSAITTIRIDHAALPDPLNLKGPNRQMFAERHLDPEPWEHDDLRCDGENVADNDIRRGLNHRHGPALPHRGPSGRHSRNAVTNSAASGGTIALP